MGNIKRRKFIKKTAAASAFTATTGLYPGIAFSNWKASDSLSEEIKWSKTPCRFCGVGCGLLVATSNGRAVAVKGDPDSSVNKGLCCVKGYHTVLALYGKDRLTKAQVRKNGQMVEVPIEEALDLVASKMQETIEEHGKNAVAMYGSTMDQP